MALPLHPRETSVVIASLTARSFDFGWADSLAGMFITDAVSCRHIVQRGAASLMKSSPRIAEARNQLVDEFLRTRGEWLLMVDSDMEWPNDALCKLLDAAYEGERKKPKRYVIGALAFAGRPYTGPMYPTIYTVARDQQENIEVGKVLDYPKDALVKCDATGGAFLLVHRQVFVRMAQPHPAGFATMPNGSPNSYIWFIEGVNGGTQFGEDIAFCLRARALGFDVWVDTRVKTRHEKSAYLDEPMYLAYRERMLKEEADAG